MSIMSCKRPAVRFNSILDDILDDPFIMLTPARAQQAAASALAIDLSETEKDVIVRASLPGFAREQVQIHVMNDVLTINAHRTDETEEKTERYHRRERRENVLSRSIPLPASVVEEKAKAELKDGVLTLTLPKHEKAQPRKIAVN